MKFFKILTLVSFLVGCAGSAPKMERPVKLFNGAPERGAICRLSKSAIARAAKKMLVQDDSKAQVKEVVKVMFAPDEIECVNASDKKFANYGCYSFSDIGVMLRWQENLLHSCEKWGSHSAPADLSPDPQNTWPAIEEGLDPEPESEDPVLEPEVESQNI